MASGRVLDAKQFLGGADNVINLELLPEQTRTFTYQFGTDVSTYAFSLDYSCILIDQLSYNINTGEPNYAASSVTGYFGNIDGAGASTVTANASLYIDDSDAVAGNIIVTIPANRYPETGYIRPSARTNVVITVAEFSWDDQGATNRNVDSHRFTIVERYSPNAQVGDPSSVNNPAEFITLE